ncbi:MAG: amidohydrolase family protein [Candidatus Hydrogenedentes bacterium]|nr:amidohydrolase family protein [Candidatus Hydrogenedentota bacterium]
MLPFSVIDTHVHLWDPALMRYPWLDSIPLLNRAHLPSDYAAACGPIQVDKIVFIQCECEPVQFLDEFAWVAGLAKTEPRIQAIVPWAPLEKGDKAREALDRLVGNPLTKGVRRIIQFEEDIEFCLRPEFVRGVQLLENYDLHFEICIAHRQLANTIKLVRQCPNVRFILDHIGKPDIANHVFEPWGSEIKALAEMPNVWCKVSGLVTEADHRNWTIEDLKPFVSHVLECFGVARCMYGSDWPVARLAAEYPRWTETLWAATDAPTQDERRGLFRGNAEEFYRLR